MLHLVVYYLRTKYEKITLGALTLLLITTACRDDSYTLSTESTPNLVTPALHTRVSDSQSPLTGIVEAYPCASGKLYLFRELCKQYAKRVLWFLQCSGWKHCRR